MNKKLVSIAIFATCISALISCSKKSSSPAVVTPVTTSPYFMKATINGSSFNAYTIETDTASGLRVTLGYESQTSAFPYINLSITATAIGTYSIDGFDALAQIDSSASSGAVNASYGSITISAINDTAVTGTFYFTCTDSTRVTNGTFYAKRTN